MGDKDQRVSPVALGGTPGAEGFRRRGLLATHDPGQEGVGAHSRTPLGGTIGTLQVAVSGEAGVEKAKGKAKALQGMLGGTVFKGKVVPKGTGPNVKKGARSMPCQEQQGKGYGVGGGSQQPLKPAKEPLPSQHAGVTPSLPWPSNIEAGWKLRQFLLAARRPAPKKHKKMGHLYYIYITPNIFSP